ncbi:MAG: alpha/beta hydrolase, partial [bacterium]|nr:alpha/beta hydrolase [bacterium]
SPSKEGERKNGIQVGGCVFVAGFSGRIDVPEISEFYSLPFDAEKAKLHCSKFTMIFSDNDSYVPMEKSLEFAQQLGAKTVLERGKGHFTTTEGVAALPSVLQSLVRMSE